MDSNSNAATAVKWANFPEYKRFVREVARDIRRRYGFEAPPHDPYAIAERMGVVVREELLSGVDGYIRSTGAKWEAVISPAAAPERRRFTLAHELGHVILLRAADAGYARHLMRFRVVGFHPELHEDPMEEALCNAFASELLLPAEDIRKKLRRGLNLPIEIPQLASEYFVSLHAASTGVVNVLGPKRTALSLWRGDSLWPLPVWWVGVKTRLRAERSQLESLVGKLAGSRDAASWTWESFNRKKVPVRITVAPLSYRYAVLYLKRETEGSWNPPTPAL